jgi:hypothetical protein
LVVDAGAEAALAAATIIERPARKVATLGHLRHNRASAVIAVTCRTAGAATTDAPGVATKIAARRLTLRTGAEAVRGASGHPLGATDPATHNVVNRTARLLKGQHARLMFIAAFPIEEVAALRRTASVARQLTFCHANPIVGLASSDLDEDGRGIEVSYDRNNSGYSILGIEQA